MVRLKPLNEKIEFPRATDGLGKRNYESKLHVELNDVVMYLDEPSNCPQ